MVSLETPKLTRNVEIIKSDELQEIIASMEAIDDFTVNQNPKFTVVSRLMLSGLEYEDVRDRVLFPLPTQSSKPCDVLLNRPRIRQTRPDQFTLITTFRNGPDRTIRKEHSEFSERINKLRQDRQERAAPVSRLEIRFGYSKNLDVTRHAMQQFPNHIVGVVLAGVVSTPEWLLRQQPNPFLIPSRKRSGE